jgi:acetate kinase
LRVLTVNAGSSSLKLRLLEDNDSLAASADFPLQRGEVKASELAEAIAGMAGADAVGHRIVHGGERFREPVRIDPEIKRALRELTDLAPLHQPKSLAALEAVSQVIPDTPAVACFDTAFHASIPRAASTYALPEEWRRNLGVRRYGFHGLSHAYAARRAAEMLGRPDLKLITCHLGAGASLAAVRNGESIDTTMGFTPLEGLVMATRSGSIDPGALLWLLERNSMTERQMAEALEQRSGLLGLAGSADMREVLERARAGDERSQLARNVYIHRLQAEIAAMAAALGQVDAVVFTGGVGESSPEVRARALTGLDFLRISLDLDRNEAPVADRLISSDRSRATALLVASREDLEMAQQVRGLLARTLRDAG